MFPNIPPNVKDMLAALSDLEKYTNESEEYAPLIRAALIHYQFETIHPVLDGTGRIGRLLILLYLMLQEIVYLLTKHICLSCAGILIFSILHCFPDRRGRDPLANLLFLMWSYIIKENRGWQNCTNYPRKLRISADKEPAQNTKKQ